MTAQLSADGLRLEGVCQPVGPPGEPVYTYSVELTSVPLIMQGSSDFGWGNVASTVLFCGVNTIWTAEEIDDLADLLWDPADRIEGVYDSGGNPNNQFVLRRDSIRGYYESYYGYPVTNIYAGQTYVPYLGTAADVEELWHPTPPDPE